MSVVLEVSLNTPPDELDPATALTDLRNVLVLLTDMEAALARRDEFNATRWRFSALKLGSLEAAVTPVIDADDARPRSRAAGLRLIEGFREVETAGTLPPAWSLASAHRATAIATHLGTDADHGLTLRLVVDNAEASVVDVTARTATNLRAATRATHQSIGSVVGALGSLSARKGRRAAGIWPERGGRRVAVSFAESDLDDVRRAVGTPRVQISGRLLRNNRGQLLRVKMRRLDVLSDHTDPDSPTSLLGADPSMTGGQDPVDYVRALRDGS